MASQIKANTKPGQTQRRRHPPTTKQPRTANNTSDAHQRDCLKVDNDILHLHNAAGPASASADLRPALGGVRTVISIDTCHDLMISEPEQLGGILVERCRFMSS